jgi:hypothetical protein
MRLLVRAMAFVSAIASFPAAGCVLPLQFEEEPDASPEENNAPPNIVQTVPDMPNGLDPIDTATTPTQVTVTLDDPDVNDILHVRVYRDYHLTPSPAYVVKETQEKGQRLRTVTFSTAGWCANASAGTTYLFELLVADREFLANDVEPLFRALPENAKSTRSFWSATCE